MQFDGRISVRDVQQDSWKRKVIFEQRGDLRNLIYGCMDYAEVAALFMDSNLNLDAFSALIFL